MGDPMDQKIIAVIDAGSNSVRLLVARALSESAFEVVDEERFDARLGGGPDASILAPEAMERGVNALRMVAQVAHSHGASEIVAVGTEALRRATNAPAFIERIRAETGLELRVLSSREEALASFLGVMNSSLTRDGTILDIGGGSVELIRVRDREFLSSTSAPLGALYARNQYLPKDPPSSREQRALRKAVRAAFDAGPAVEIAGVGGAIRNIARIIRQRGGYPLRRLHGLVIERREIARLTAALVRVPTEERRRIPGVSAGRADVLHAVAIVVDEVMEISGAARLHVSGQGLREGLVWQQIRPASPVIPDVREASVMGLARANGIDALAAEPVANAAATLFEGTKSLHRLAAADLDLLLHGARLAGVGLHVDYYNRDRHAEYLVHSGDLHGFSHREIVLLGMLVRCADGGSPDAGPYRALISPDDPRRIAVLAALLGAARAIRRRVPSPVLSVQVEPGRRALAITLLAESPIDAERIALERQAGRLEAALGTPVRIHTEVGAFAG